MSHPESEPSFISFDIDQWRRDIQAFAGTTRDALDAIVSELTNQCSGTPNPVRRSTTSEVANRSKRRVEQPSANPSKESGNRLSQLKQKLASRLEQS